MRNFRPGGHEPGSFRYQIGGQPHVTQRISKVPRVPSLLPYGSVSTTSSFRSDSYPSAGGVLRYLTQMSSSIVLAAKSLRHRKSETRQKSLRQRDNGSGPTPTRDARDRRCEHSSSPRLRAPARLC